MDLDPQKIGWIRLTKEEAELVCYALNNQHNKLDSYDKEVDTSKKDTEDMTKLKERVGKLFGIPPFNK